MIKFSDLNDDIICLPKTYLMLVTKKKIMFSVIAVVKEELLGLENDHSLGSKQLLC